MADAPSRKSYCNNHMACKAQPLQDNLNYKEHMIRVLDQAERHARLKAIKFLKLSDQILLKMKPLGNARIVFVMNTTSCFLLPPKSRDEISCSGGEL